MKKKIIGLAMLCSFLAGCETFFPYTGMHDSAVVNRAQSMAQVNTCQKLGLIPQELAMQYGYALSQYLSAVVYDEDLYEQTYKYSMSLAPNYITAEARAGCASMEPLLARSTIDLQNQTRDAIGWKAAGRQDFAIQAAAAANSIGETAKSYNQVPVSMPSSGVTFSGKPASSRTNHYLINTASGMKQCHVTDTGFVFCT